MPGRWLTLLALLAWAGGALAAEPSFSDLAGGGVVELAPPGPVPGKGAMPLAAEPWPSDLAGGGVVELAPSGPVPGKGAMPLAAEPPLLNAAGAVAGEGLQSGPSPGKGALPLAAEPPLLNAAGAVARGSLRSGPSPGKGALPLAGEGLKSGPGVRVELRRDGESRPVYAFELAPGQTFSLEFINSIYLAPVKETFRAEPGRGLVLVRVDSPSPRVFEYYGLSEIGSARMERPLGAIRLLSADYGHHRLDLPQGQLALADLVGPGEALWLGVAEPAQPGGERER